MGATLAPEWFAERGAAPQALAAADPLPIPTSSERVLARAQALRSAGHLLDAVRTLETIDVADPLRAEADRLRAELQRQLIATAPMEATR